MTTEKCKLKECVAQEMMARIVLVPILFFLMSVLAFAGERELIRPIRIFPDKGTILLLGRNGSLLRVNAFEKNASHKQVELAKVAHRASDIVRVGSDLFAVSDEANSEIRLLHIDTKNGSLRQSIKVPLVPKRIAVSKDGQTIAISLLWARQLAILSFDAKQQILSNLRTIDLEFAPQELLFLPPENKVLVADAFGAKLTIVDTSAATIVKRFEIPGHNIRGMSLDAKRESVLLSHQMLNGFVPTSRDHVFWGNVVSNVLRTISLTRIDNADKNQTLHGTIVPLGESNRASGDPGKVLVSKQGHTLVALSGVHEVAVRSPRKRGFRRLQVKRRPIDIAEIGQGRIAVANGFDDSISLIDLNNTNSVETIPLNDRVSRTSVERGEELFYDATLSLDGWFSCHSCHSDGHSPGLTSDNLGDDTFGSPKRIISLLGVNQSAPWAWNGSQFNLTDQVRKSVYQTMHGAERHKVLTEDVMAITAYLRTLDPPPSVSQARGESESPEFERGRKSFESVGCHECHRPPYYTSPSVESIGIADDKVSELNPPSLVGVSQRNRLLHDGRATSVTDVLTTHDHQGASSLDPHDLRDLIAFLMRL